MFVSMSMYFYNVEVSLVISLSNHSTENVHVKRALTSAYLDLALYKLFIYYVAF